MLKFNPDKEYYYLPKIIGLEYYHPPIQPKCKGFNYLQFLIINYNKITDGLEKIKNEISENNIDYINHKNDDGLTALMIASSNTNTFSSIEIVKLLIENGANVNLQNNDGVTALMISSIYSNSYSSLDAVKLLIENEADLNIRDRDGNTALLLSYMNSDKHSSLDAVKLLIENGADINLEYSISRTTILYLLIVDYHCSNKEDDNLYNLIIMFV